MSTTQSKAEMRRKLQVFVSSTFADLVVERQAAVAAILKAGHIPAGMELFTAGDKSQMETIERWIDESDIYMLILGGRYGSIEPVTGMSYTELEYDYAMQQGKPFFAVVINEAAIEGKVRAYGTSMIEKDNPGPLKLFRSKVLSNISSFFDDEKDIRLSVYESLADLKLNPLIKGWIFAGDVEDTKSLHEEIVRLKEELATLKADGGKTSSPSLGQNAKIVGENFSELIHILSQTEVKIPAPLTPDNEEFTTDLFSLFIHNKDTLINGVTNASGMSDAQQFLYFNLCPKLMVHGLISNEKVPGVRYRRSFVNGRGLALLAEVEHSSKRGKCDIKTPKTLTANS